MDIFCVSIASLSFFDFMCTQHRFCVRFCIGFGQNSLFLPPYDGVFQVEWSALSILRIKLERWYRMYLSIDKEVNLDEK